MGGINSVYKYQRGVSRSHTEIKTLQTCACCSSVVSGKGGLERWLVVGASIHKLGICLVQEAGN